MDKSCSQNGRRQGFQNFNSEPTPAGKRRLGRPRGRWEDNIRMDLTEIGMITRNWVDSAQDRDY